VRIKMKRKSKLKTNATVRNEKYTYRYPRDTEGKPPKQYLQYTQEDINKLVDESFNNL